MVRQVDILNVDPYRLLGMEIVKAMEEMGYKTNLLQILYMVPGKPLNG